MVIDPNVLFIAGYTFIRPRRSPAFITHHLVNLVNFFSDLDGI